MWENWTVVGTDAEFESDEEVKKIYGDDVVVSRSGRFRLIHLDDPGPEEVERRTAEFDPETLFDDDCPLCRMLREKGGHVVYGSGEVDEEDPPEDFGVRPWTGG